LGFGATFVRHFGEEFWQGSLGFGATFVGRFGKEFWQGILEGSLGFGATFCKGHFCKAAYIELCFYNIKTVF